MGGPADDDAAGESVDQPASEGSDAPAMDEQAPGQEPAADDAAETPPASRFATDYVPPPPKPMFKNRRRLTEEEVVAQRKRRAIRRRRRRIIGLSLAGLGLVILVTSAWVAWRTYQAYSHLQTASDEVSALQTQIKDITSIDLDKADQTVADLQSQADKANSAVSDPLYRLATHVPFVGPNLHAIGEVSGTVDSLAQHVVPSLVQIARTLSPASLAPKNDVVNLAPIEAAAPLLQSADSAVNAARIRLANIDRSGVVAQVNTAVLKLWSKLDSAASITATGARVSRLLPPMMGSNGARTYLLAFQNLAEVRATGGIFGSFATVRVDQGLITVVDKGRSSRELGTFQPPIETFPPKIISLYSNLLSVYPQDVNLRPDFPTAAATYAKMYTMRKGTPIDGVIATDPVALSYAMKGMSPIDVGDGVTLTSQNIVSTLLSAAYTKFPTNADQGRRDSFLATATSTAFSKVLSGSNNAGAVLSGLKQAASENRMLLWSANVNEQADIMQTGLAGSISDMAGPPSIGVFFNDGTGAKLDYYLTNSVRVVPGSCHPYGRRELAVQISVTYDPPKVLPAYVLGGSTVGLNHEVQTNVIVFAPVGGGVVNAARDGLPIYFQRGEDRSREVAQVTITLKPGATTVLDVTVLAPAVQSPPGQHLVSSLILTPGVKPWAVSSEPFDGCSASG